MWEIRALILRNQVKKIQKKDNNQNCYSKQFKPTQIHKILVFIIDQNFIEKNRSKFNYQQKPIYLLNKHPIKIPSEYSHTKLSFNKTFVVYLNNNQREYSYQVKETSINQQTNFEPLIKDINQRKQETYRTQKQIKEMTIIKIQFNKQIRKYCDPNAQLGKIYSFIMKRFEDIPQYFELQYRHPLNKIKRQLMNNEQLYDLLQIKQNITLIVKPIICENISRYQISREQNTNYTQQPSVVLQDMVALLERLSLHNTLSDSQNQENKNFKSKFIVRDSDDDENIVTNQNQFSHSSAQAYTNKIIHDERDFLIKDETNEYVEQMFCLSSDDDSSEQIELNF